MRFFYGLVDHFLIDLKIADPSEHRRYTGADNGPIWSNFERLLQRTRNIAVRIPVIPGVTDSEDNVRSIAARVFSIDPSIPVELLNYNPASPGKYRELGRAYLFDRKVAPLTESQLAALAAVVADARRRKAGVPKFIDTEDSTVRKVFILIDIAGTKTTVALCEKAPDISTEFLCPPIEKILTVATEQEPEVFLSVILPPVRDALRDRALSGIGIGRPGALFRGAS
jgi:hypothetical protein